MHYWNNQLHPILDEEEEDLEMFVEDDGWEEKEVVPSNEDELSLTSTASMLKSRAV